MPEIQGPRALLCTCDTVARLASVGGPVDACMCARARECVRRLWLAERNVLFTLARTHIYEEMRGMASGFLVSERMCCESA